MNERIRELAEQAGAETWSRAPMRAVTGLAFTDENLEKFAELIVRECIRQCESQNTVITTGIGTEAWGEISDAVEQIKEHFGVRP